MGIIKDKLAKDKEHLKSKEGAGSRLRILGAGAAYNAYLGRKLASHLTNNEPLKTVGTVAGGTAGALGTAALGLKYLKQKEKKGKS